MAEPDKRKASRLTWLILGGVFFAAWFIAMFLLSERTGREAIGSIMAILSTVIVLGLYFIPAIVARRRDHHQRLAIFFLNLLLGWTLLGWIIALIWSLTAVRRDNDQSVVAAAAYGKVMAKLHAMERGEPDGQRQPPRDRPPGR